MLLKIINVLMSCLDKLIDKLKEAKGFLKTCKLCVYDKMLIAIDKEIRAAHLEMWLLEGKVNWLKAERADIEAKINEL